MQLKWVKCQGDVWCRLDAVNLAHAHFKNMYGVYVIWHGGANSHVVYVGQGNIRERLSRHRTDPEVQAFKGLNLYATWAAVASAERNGVEKYLADKWGPRVGAGHPDVPWLEVNSPWN